MLFNRLVSIAAALSLVGSALAAPIPRPLETNLPGGGELEAERESDGKYEVELEPGVLPVEVEVEIEGIPAVAPKSGLTRRVDSERSMAGSIATAQKHLDVLKPQLGESLLLSLR